MGNIVIWSIGKYL